ncbi:uncharacterized protein LOC129598076 [Paramacrobiotus metropolitanus]|uniref:uncharacterized protein LOC129598076 n=1 Tax=Paramacrobiotus metropolitanus TaxID=2943436 RepID=UPI00244573F5|nr:uncharacterized protein LOC129598076 [Paramacrobiotus metropolitanus]
MEMTDNGISDSGVVEEIGSSIQYRYTKTDFIGRGTFGIVYKAKVRKSVFRFRAPPEPDFVAVKVMHLAINSETIANQENWMRVAKRLRQLTELKHNHLVLYHKVSITKSSGGVTVELAMDYHKGDLASFLREAKENATLLNNWEKVIRFAGDMTQGLEFLHQNGIIHGDLKPENILLSVSRNGSEKLVIGGLDDLVQMKESATCSADISQLRGTTRYMSPEMLRKFSQQEAARPGRKTDMWSLGCIILEMAESCVRGAPKFEGHLCRPLAVTGNKIVAAGRTRYGDVKKIKFHLWNVDEGTWGQHELDPSLDIYQHTMVTAVEDKAYFFATTGIFTEVNMSTCKIAPSTQPNQCPATFLRAAATCRERIFYATDSRLLQYDTVIKEWKYLPDRQQRRFDFAMAVVIGHVYIMGGKFWNDAALNYTATAECIRLKLGSTTWEKIEPLHQPRFWHAACVVKDRIYICGGRHTGIRKAVTIEVYDTRADAGWSTVNLSPKDNEQFAASLAEYNNLWGTRAFTVSVNRYSTTSYNKERKLQPIEPEVNFVHLFNRCKRIGGCLITDANQTETGCNALPRSRSPAPVVFAVEIWSQPAFFSAAENNAGCDQTCSLTSKQRFFLQPMRSIRMRISSAMKTIKTLEEITQGQKGELQSLRQTLADMEIIKASQETAAEKLDIYHGTSAQPNQNEIRFHVFERMIDQLFQTYEPQVDASSFQALSDTTSLWLEEQCSPSSIMALTNAVLRDCQ